MCIMGQIILNQYFILPSERERNTKYLFITSFRVIFLQAKLFEYLTGVWMLKSAIFAILTFSIFVKSAYGLTPDLWDWQVF